MFEDSQELNRDNIFLCGKLMAFFFYLIMYGILIIEWDML